MKPPTHGELKWKEWKCKMQQIKVELYIIIQLLRKDVRLPIQLQRAMAAEAEAAREARAKVKIKRSIKKIY